MKNGKALLIISFVIISSFFALRIYGMRGHWVCKNGFWLAVGHPIKSRPSEGCADKDYFDSEVAKLASIVEDGPYIEKKNSTLSVSISSSTENVSIISPAAGELMSSPFEIIGSAPGSWFSEGSLPIEILSVDDDLVWSGKAAAQGEWMSDKPVLFRVTAIFTASTSLPVKIVIKKDNPSGLAPYEASISFPSILAP